MLSKQLLIFSFIILVVEYYSLVAVRNVVRQTNDLLHGWLFLLYAILSLVVLWSLYAFPHYGRGVWPSVSVKYFVNIFVVLFIGKLLVGVIMLSADLFMVIPNLVSYLFSFKNHPIGNPPDGSRFISRFTFISQTALLIGGVLSTGLAYGISNRYRYRLIRVKVSLKHLPDEFKGMKIIQISDIHSGSFDDPAAVAKGVDAIMNAKPDLIVFTGDLVNEQADEMIPYRRIFSQLKAPMGVYSVMGNHDYGDYVSWPTEKAKRENLEKLRQHHADMGWRLLLNEHVLLKRNEQQIALIGIENWGAKRFAKYGDMKKAVAGLENTDVKSKILLSHDPSHWEAEVRKDYTDIDLTLSGHTHGMQFGIDIPGFKWSPVQYVYKQWAGLYQQENQYLYVNRGFGFIGYQGRLGMLPEITLIELA